MTRTNRWLLCGAAVAAVAALLAAPALAHPRQTEQVYVVRFTTDGAEKAFLQQGHYISRQQAERLALAGAGVSSPDYLHTQLELDGERAVYVVEFRDGSDLRSCRVDAVTGAVLE